MPAKFAELLGEIVWDTKTNVKARMEAKCGACEDKKRIATLAKKLNLERFTIRYMKCARTKRVTAKVSRAFTIVTSRNSRTVCGCCRQTSDRGKGGFAGPPLVFLSVS